MALASAFAGRSAAFVRIARHRHMRRALLAYLGFAAVEWAVWIVVLVYAHAEGSATTVGLVAVVQLVPAALLAPALASLVDRLPRSLAPLFAYGVIGGSLTTTAWAMLAGAPFVVVVALATVTNILIGLGRPAHHSLTPCLARGPSELVAANVVATSSEGLGLFAGPAFVGILMDLYSPGVALVACAAVLAIATLSMMGLPHAPMPTSSDGDHHGEGIGEGVRLLRREPTAQPPLAMAGIQGVLEGGVDVLIVLLAIDVLGLGDGGAGYLNSAVGIGAIVGGLAASTLVGRSRLAPALAVSVTITAGAMALIAILPVAGVLLAMVGIGYSLTSVATRTMLQRVSPVPLMGRMFGLLEAVRLGGLAVGAAAAPLVSERLGVESTFAVFGGLLAAILALVWRRLRLADAASEVPTAILAQLRSAEVLAGLEPEVLEAMARGSTVESLPARQTVVVEGDPGELMYVIGDGGVEVSRRGKVVATLGPGDVFGEVALLADSPRIATVTTTQPTSMVVVTRQALFGALATEPGARLAMAHLAAIRSRDTLGESP